MGKRRTHIGRSGRDAAPQRPYVGDQGALSAPPAGKAATAFGMVALAVAFGLAIGFLVFLVMNLSGWLTTALWGGYLSGALGFAPFPLLVCMAGGLAIGIWTRFTGSAIEPLEQVLATFKRTGSYRVGAVKGTVSFLLPLVFGGSVGFEAGLTGIIAAACCWIRDRLKAAGLRAGAVADATISASLSAVFGTPLAGIVAGAESAPAGGGDLLDEADPAAFDMRRPAKIVLYTAAAFGAYAGVRLFSALFGASSGFPHFDPVATEGAGFLWALLALAAAYAMTWLYHGSSAAFSRLSARMDGSAAARIARPVVAGAIVGAFAIALPYVLFPGEEQSHMLMESWGLWPAAALMATGLLKAVATPLCINMGWVGGSFCPSIFAGAACGYALSALTGADPMLMVTVTVTAFLAGVTRKPLLTIAILLLCFPLESILWCGLAAVAGAYLPIPRKLLESGHHARMAGRPGADARRLG